MNTEKISETKKKSTQKWPRVAIIILNWNGWKDTIECLESLKKITYPNYQVIVVDNGSTDDSVTRIREAYPKGKDKRFDPCDSREFLFSTLLRLMRITLVT